MPSNLEIRLLDLIPGANHVVDRLRRRQFLPLSEAPLVQSRFGEWRRIVQRLTTSSRRQQEVERQLAHEANQWLMATLSKFCHKADAVHSYEDCSLGAFVEAKKNGKMCLYDLPIGYYRAWQRIESDLAQQYPDWQPERRENSIFYANPKQKEKEMELADVVLAPSTFVQHTVLEFINKPVYVVPYGVDIEARPPQTPKGANDTLHFLYAGHISMRKGIPLLLQAWKNASLRNAHLHLAGAWLAPEKHLSQLPKDVTYHGHLSRTRLERLYQSVDVFVFPSFFEGFGLVITEAMASGLPVICSDATCGPDLVDQSCGRVFQRGDVDHLVACLEWSSARRDELPEIGKSAHQRASRFNWKRYRDGLQSVIEQTM